MTARGWRRRLLMTTERVACRLSTRVLCVSASARQTALDERLCPPEKIVVLGAGSCNGVDACERFEIQHYDQAARAEVRELLRLPVGAPVLGFVGRVVREKGIGELAEAWQRLAMEFPALHLIIVGPLETGDPVPTDVVAALQAHQQVVRGLVDPVALLDVAADAAQQCGSDLGVRHGAVGAAGGRQGMERRQRAEAIAAGLGIQTA